VGALAESYRAVPAGGLTMTAEVADWAFARVGLALALALRAAAPAALALVLAGLALGLLGRSAPTLQLMALSLPVRWAAAMLLVLLGLAALAGMLTVEWSSFMNAEYFER